MSIGNEISSIEHPLVLYAKKQLDEGKQKVHLIENDQEKNEFISPLGEFPHAYVLACIMDRQIKAENAWVIPWEISKKIGGFDFPLLCKIPLKKLKDIFQEVSKHRFKNDMAEYFHAAIQRISKQYDGDARKIWNDTPPSGLLISRFLQFDGVGLKIATMATNILVRQFGVQLKENSSIDISPDVHIMRIFHRLGLISSNKREEAIYMARALNPEYPGIVDYACWDVGQKYCDANTPKCADCPFKEFCKEGEKL